MSELELTDATLMQLCNSFVAAVMESEGDWTPALEALDKAIDGKVERYQRAAHFIRAKRAAVMAESAYYMNLAKGFADKAKTLSNQDDRMEQALLKMMHETGKTVVETTLGTLRIRKTPHVELDADIAALMANLPQGYIRKPDPEVDKKALLNDFRALVKAFIGAGLDEDHAIASAKLKMPPLVTIVYNESVGGY